VEERTADRTGSASFTGDAILFSKVSGAIVCTGKGMWFITPSDAINRQVKSCHAQGVRRTEGAARTEHYCSYVRNAIDALVPPTLYPLRPNIIAFREYMPDGTYVPQRSSAGTFCEAPASVTLQRANIVEAPGTRRESHTSYQLLIFGSSESYIYPFKASSSGMYAPASAIPHGTAFVLAKIA